MKARHRLQTFTIAKLLGLLADGRADRIQLEVGWPPALFLKHRKSLLSGPDLTEAAVGQLVGTLLDTRRRRTFRKCGVVQVVHVFRRQRYLFWVVNAFGVFRIDVETVPSKESDAPSR